MKKKSIIILCFMVILAIALNYIAFFGLEIVGVNYKGVFDEERGIKKGIDLAGGSVLTFQALTDDPTEEEMAVVETIFAARMNNANYTEARISHNDEGQITVEIPDLFDTNSAVELLGSTAKLEFKNVAGEVVLDGGTHIEDARYVFGQLDEYSAAEPHIQVKLNAEGQQKFAEATRAAAAAGTGNNFISIQMDDQVISSPMVEKEINSATFVIQGQFTQESAQTLANQIKSGSLPFELEKISDDTTGAELGEDALPLSLLAAGIGIVIIMIFMIIVYRIPGLIADLALALYIGIIALVLGLTRTNLSVAGIAGIVLSIGMAVDANVIIFERMKEELKLGKTIKASVDAGFSKAFSAILDSNITTIITCVVLYLSGINTIRGFAVTLGLGVVVSMFTAIVLTKLILKQLVQLNIKNRKLFCK